MRSDSTTWPRYPSLSRSEVRALSKKLRAQGEKLPKVGWCLRVEEYKHGVREVCRDRNGYYFLWSK